MARGVNKVILIGNLVADPETRYMPSGGAVTNVTIATNEQWRDKQTNEQKERVEFHRTVFFNKLAEIAGQYLKKGSKVYVEGSLRTRQWEKDGQKHYATEIVASEMQMLDGRGDTGQQPGGGQRRANMDVIAGSARAYRDASGGRSAKPAADASFDVDDFDELAF